MALAANTLIESHGGLAVVMETGCWPICRCLWGNHGAFIHGDHGTGCSEKLKSAVPDRMSHKSFEMTLSLAGLVVLGELHLSNRGLVALQEGQPPGLWT